MVIQPDSSQRSAQLWAQQDSSRRVWVLWTCCVATVVLYRRRASADNTQHIIYNTLTQIRRPVPRAVSRLMCTTVFTFQCACSVFFLSIMQSLQIQRELLERRQISREAHTHTHTRTYPHIQIETRDERRDGVYVSGIVELWVADSLDTGTDSHGDIQPS